MEQVALLAFLIFAAAVLYSSVGHAGASDLYPKMLDSSLRHSCPQERHRQSEDSSNAIGLPSS